MKKTLLVSIYCAVTLALQSQSFLKPAPAQSERIAITGANLHVGNGKMINQGILAFDQGRITYVGSGEDFDTSGHRLIDASRKEVYPGFIAANTTLGLREIEAVRATNDHDEVGAFIAHTRSIIAYNTDSRVTPTVRSNGILMAQIVPQGGRISGRSTIVQLDAWNWEDAAVATDEGLHLRWPSLYQYKGWWAAPGNIVQNEKYGDQIQELKMYFAQAKEYAPSAHAVNLGFEAMQDLFAHRQRLYIHANHAIEIMDGVRWANGIGIKPVIVGARDAWQITNFLSHHEVDIIVMQPHSLPHLSHSDITQPYRLPALLYEAGLSFGLGMYGFWEQRNLPFQAGQAVSYGLPYEVAIQSMTQNIASIMGIQDRCGSLEVGKDATFFISEGDILDMRTSRVIRAFIQGRDIDLNNKQKMLRDKFRDKYNAD